MYKKDLVLNGLQWSISHKTKPNQSTNIYLSIYLSIYEPRIYLSIWKNLELNPSVCDLYIYLSI